MRIENASESALEKHMSKRHFTGFLAALAVTAAQFLALEAGSATTPEDRGNPAVADEVYTDSRLAAPASASHLRDVVA
jgi:hypothetical protein